MKLLALLLALLLWIPSAGAEEDLLTLLGPVMDEAVAAAVPEDGYAYHGMKPTFLDASEDGDAVRILGDVYAADGPLDSQDAYAGAVWLDSRAVVEFRLGSDGWTMTSFALDAEWEMEEAAQEHFQRTMVEYVNTALGYSIQYPVIFTEESIRKAVGGIAGEVDGAAFSVTCQPNDGALTLDAFLAGKKQEIPGAETNINDISGGGRIVARTDGFITQVTVYVTESAVYQAELRYHESMSEALSLYCDYMMNSFSVDEMGLG